MVTDLVVEQTETRWYMAVAGLVLLIAGLQGLTSPDAWVLATGMAGQIFNALPNVIHQVLGGLLAVGGITQIGTAIGIY